MTRIRILLFFCCVACCGIAVIPALTVDTATASAPHAITVSYRVDGLSPELTEVLATSPIENTLSQIAGYKKITSFSGKGHGRVELRFSENENIAVKRFEIVSALRMLFPSLDPAVSYPVVEVRSANDAARKPLLIYSVSGHYSLHQVQQAVLEDVVKPIAQLPGVKDIDIAGAARMQLTVAYDSKLLDKRKITVERLEEALAAMAFNIPLGKKETHAGQIFSTRMAMTTDDINQVENVRVPDSIHAPRLKELANVYWEEQKPNAYFRVNGLQSVTVSVYADDNVNEIMLADQVKTLVKEEVIRMPPGYSVFLEHDDTDYLKNELQKNYYRSAMAFVVLLIFISLVYRNFRYVVMLLLCVLLTLLFSLFLCWVFKIPIHLFTLAGLSISFGIVVDNAILVLDHLHRNGRGSVLRQVVGGTLIIVVVMLLVFFLPPEERANLGDFSLIVSVTLACSVPVALVGLPVIYDLWSTRQPLTTKQSSPVMRRKVILFRYYHAWIAFGARHKGKVLVCCVLGFGTPVFLLPSRWDGQEWYNHTIGNAYYQQKVRPYIDKISGGALRLFVNHVYERSAYREPGKTRLFVHASLPPGHTIDDMDKVIQGMENYLKEVTGIEKFMSYVYSGDDARITIDFEDAYQHSALPFQLKGHLVARSMDWAGVEWNIFGVGQGFNNGNHVSLPAFSIKMCGYNYDVLEAQARTLAAKLMRHERIQKVDINERFDTNEKKSWQPTLVFDEHALALSGANASDVTRYLHEMSEKGTTIPLMIANKQVPVLLREKNAGSLSLFGTTHHTINTGQKQVTLNGSTTLTKESSTGSIRRENRQFVRMVGFEYYGSYEHGSAYLKQVLDEMKLEMPVGYTAKAITDAGDWKDKSHWSVLMVLLFIVVYIVSLVLFESFRKPLMVVIVIPVSFIGLLLTFGWFQFFFDSGGYAAFILLGGLAVKSSMIVLDAMKEGERVFTSRALAKAVYGKVRPILLTVLSTCVGLLPFLVGGDKEVFWFALAAGTIGGLVASLAGVFYVGPVLLVRHSKHKSLKH